MQKELATIPETEQEDSKPSATVTKPSAKRKPPRPRAKSAKKAKSLPETEQEDSKPSATVTKPSAKLKSPPPRAKSVKKVKAKKAP